MAQESPADTAGPSSPPPRLPEGWLPQWEGVERKWYYVQRATGKSQWELPTEPVALSPSPTPTFIGIGPSHAPPSRQPGRSPEVSASGGPSEPFENPVENSAHTGLRGAQLGGQSSYRSGGPSEATEYTGRSNHHPPQYYQGADRNDYGMPRAAGYPDSVHAPMYNAHVHAVQPMYQSHGPESGFAPLSRPLRSAYPATEAVQRVEDDFVAHHAQVSFPHTSWNERIGHPTVAHGIDDPVQTALPQYPQQREMPSIHPASQSTSVSNHHLYNTAHTTQWPMHPYSTRQVVPGHYQSTSMGRTQSGPDTKSLGFPATPQTRGDARDYQNPLVQAGVQQYLPQQDDLYVTSRGDHRSGGHSHQPPTFSRECEKWTRVHMPLRTAVSDPQFVSGPWASTASPIDDSSQPHRYS